LGKVHRYELCFCSRHAGYRYAQGKKVLFMTQEQAEMVDRLTREYGKILIQVEETKRSEAKRNPVIPSSWRS
jgi:hypothetical protein